MESKVTAILTIAIIATSLSSALPIDPNEPTQDILQASQISLQDMANIAMSPHMQALDKPVDQVPEKSAEASTLLETSQDITLQAGELPLVVAKETGAVGAKIPAAAAIKGSVVGSAVATPIILKAVALPGLAAGKTAALFSLPNLFLAPHLLATNAHSASQQLTANIKAAVEDQAHQLTDFLVQKQLLAAEEAEEENPEDLPLLNIDLQDGINQAVQTVVLLKAGALGAAAKGVAAAKKGAYVAGRVILKPIAILTGIHLKLVGSGLAFGGKLIGGTGAGIAKAGTAVKFTGLGAIGLGASAVSWGLDRSTIDTRIEANANVNANVN